MVPQAINNAGIIVGQIGNEEVPVLPNPVNTPAMIFNGNRLSKLDDLIDPNSGFSIYNAVAITDTGVILATCTRKSAPDTYLNCLLTPTGL